MWWSGQYNVYLYLYVVVWPVQCVPVPVCGGLAGRYNYVPVPVCGGLAGTNSVVLTHSGRTKEIIKVNIENIPE